MNHAKSDSPIFVVGCPRSGTTLMRFCLVRHPNIYIGPETGFWAKVFGNRKIIPEWRLKGRIRYLVERMFKAVGDPSMAEFEEKKEWIIARAENASSYKELAVAVMGSFAEIKNKKRWGEKTPYHAMFLEEILQVFPVARVINMVRNPKAVVASYINCGHLPPNLYNAVADYRNFTARVPETHKSVLNIRYEDLVTNPEETLRNVCRFIEEDFYAEMLLPQVQDSAYHDDIIEYDESIGIEKESLEMWRSVLTDHQQNLIDELVQTNGGLPPVRLLIPWILMKRKELINKLYYGRARMGIEGYKRLNLWLIGG